MPDDLLRTALDDDPRKALAAARALAGLPADRLVLAWPVLREELVSISASARRRALLVCGVLGPLAVDLVADLLASLAGPRWPVREAALHALARIDPANEPVRAAAAEAALDRSAAVREAAVELLASRPGLPASLAAALEHRHPRVRCRALKALARLAPAESIAPLTAALAQSHYRVRRTASALLGGLGALALPAAGRLARCRFDGETAVAAAAGRALERLRPHLPDVLAPLFGTYADPPALLAALLAGDAPLREAAEAVRRQRLSRLRKPDPLAEARWLIGFVVDEAVRRSR
jgi:HEAT repeat protein